MYHIPYRRNKRMMWYVWRYQFPISHCIKYNNNNNNNNINNNNNNTTTNDNNNKNNNGETLTPPQVFVNHPPTPIYYRNLCILRVLIRMVANITVLCSNLQSRSQMIKYTIWIFIRMSLSRRRVVIYKSQLLPSLYTETRVARSGGDRRWGHHLTYAKYTYLVLLQIDLIFLPPHGNYLYVSVRRRGKQDEAPARHQCTCVMEGESIVGKG